MAGDFFCVLYPNARANYHCSMNYVRLKDVISQMDSLDGEGKPMAFDMKFVTADKKRGTGGEIINVKGARKCVGKRNDEVIFDQRPRTDALVESVSRNPHHFSHATRNIALKNGAIRTIHIRLIIEFNGKKVCF